MADKLGKARDIPDSESDRDNHIYYVNMSHFTLNPNFKNQLSFAFDRWAEQIYDHTDDVISTPRFWDGWTVTNPFRDIIDTERLRNSGTLEKVGTFKYRMQWETPYVGYVYFGYVLQNGRAIPARQWVHVAFDENDYRQELIDLLNK